MVNILMVTHSLSPDKRIDQEAESLAKQGYNVSIICGGLKKNSEPPKVYQEVFYVPLTKYQQAFLYFPVKQAVKKYANIFDKIKPDVIHAHDLMAGNACRLAIKKNMKFVYDDHEVWDLIRKIKITSVKNPFRKLIRIFLFLKSKIVDKKVMKKADLIVVVNDYWKNFYSKKGFDKNKFITIENFPKQALIDDAINYQGTFDEFILNDTRKKVVFASARSKASKDDKRKIDIYAEVIQELDDWVMVIFGPVDEKYQQLGVHFIPPKPIVEYLANCTKCDAILNPCIINEKTDYSSGNRIFEAANLGIRIITSKIKTLQDKFGNVLIEVPQGIRKEELRTILENFDQYPTGEEIKKIAKQYIWENQVDTLANGYKKLLE